MKCRPASKTLPLTTALAQKACFTLLLCILFTAPPCSAQSGTGDRQQSLDFEDSTVEGVNKKPLDSLSQISDRDKKRKKNHLYWKRTDFKSDTQETLREMRYF